MFDKRLLYLTENRLSAWLWQRGQLSPIKDFDFSEEGTDEFRTYLTQGHKSPIYLLVDVVEEDFRNETIPHIVGKDRHALIQRKLQQLFRTATYRQAMLQGREKEGRQDDKLLFTALTNEELLKPWIEAILSNKQPLAGIYSLPLLSQLLVAKIGFLAPHQLLVTRESTFALRQTYFQQGLTKFSRLTLLTPTDITTLHGTINRECLRTQQYLNSLRLLPRDLPLDIGVLLTDDGTSPSDLESLNTQFLRYQPIKLDDICAKVGFTNVSNERSGELLFLHLIGKFSPSQHYAAPPQLWYNLLRLVRLGILGTTITTLAIGAYLSAVNIDNAYDNYAESAQIDKDKNRLSAQTQAIRKNFPQLPTSTENMKAVVEQTEAVMEKSASIEQMLTIISKALAAEPSVTVREIDWTLGNKAPATSDPLSPPINVGRPLVISAGKPEQTAVIECEIIPFTSFRAALDNAQHFVEELKRTPGLQVTPLSMPVDVSPNASLSGSAGIKQSETLSFSVKLVLKPKP